MILAGITLYNPNMTILEKNIEAKWIEPSKSVADSVAPVINKIAEKIDDEHITDSGFVLKDLYLINYLNVEDEEINDNLALNFAKDLIELTNGSNMSYEFVFNMRRFRKWFTLCTWWSGSCLL